MNSPLVQLTLARVREFTREPEAVFWAVFFPILLAAGLGVAFGGRPSAAITVGASSPEITAALRVESALDVRELTPAEAERALRDGTIALAVEPGASGGVVYRYDDTNPDGRSARLLADAAIQRAAGRRDPVAAADVVAREPGSRYIDFLVPGLVGIGIMGNAIWGIGFSIVDARRRKLMKRFMATPMSRAHYLESFLLWRMMVLAIEIGIPMGFGALAFGVPIRGHWIDILSLSVLGSLAFSALGLLVASRPKTIEAVSGVTNLVVMPMWIFSGVFFSAQRFPDFAQPLIRALPLTALVDALRGVVLRGARLWEFPSEIAILAGWLIVSFTLALKLFRWR
jgi:ABC-type multidrug transport system permease subunit